MAAEPKRKRRTRRESRALMLQAGAELALESLDVNGRTVDPLAFIRIADVAERATEIVRRTDPDAGAVTTGSIYPIWGDQSAYLCPKSFREAAIATLIGFSEPIDPYAT